MDRISNEENLAYVREIRKRASRGEVLENFGIHRGVAGCVRGGRTHGNICSTLRRDDECSVAEILRTQGRHCDSLGSRCCWGQENRGHHGAAGGKNADVK
jgi:hypothetical protein